MRSDMSDETPIQGECDPRFSRVRDLFATNLRNGEVGGAVAATLDGSPVIDLWGGFADAERTRPWERDTIVNVYSTTKGMTATCLHRLVDEGRLDLDAPVAKYWPEFEQAGKGGIPVRYLLSHQAGLPAIRKPLPGGSLFDWDVMVDALASEEPWWEPGTKHGYHAMTFGFLVGEVLRRIDGRTLGTYFREEIADPLALDFHIGLDASADVRCAEIIMSTSGSETTSLMSTFLKDLDSMTALAFTNPPVEVGTLNTRAWRGAEIPAANGHGTARSLARAYGALARGGELDGVRVLSRESVERASAEQVFGPDAVLLGIPMRFGLGFLLTQPLIQLGPNPRSFGHAGFGGSIAFADPDARIGFGYVTDQMQMTLLGDWRFFGLVRALYGSL
jgi:CubicO group peptidase (beta-lactamase class C family)